MPTISYTTGVKYPAKVSITQSTTGDADWTNPEFVAASDDNRATCAVVAGQSEIMYCSNFDFQLPVGAVVTEIEVLGEGFDDSGSTVCNLCQIHQNGTLVGTNLNGDEGFSTGTPGGPDVSTILNGSGRQEISNWGAAVQALTASDWNASTIGVALRFESTGAETFSLDGVTMELTYTLEVETSEIDGGVGFAASATGGGTKFPTVATQSATANPDWSNLSNMFTSNDSRATCVIASGGGQSETVFLSGFGFDLPQDAVVTGIQCFCEGQEDVAGATVLNSLALQFGGTVIGLANQIPTAFLGFNADLTTKINSNNRIVGWFAGALAASVVNDSAFGISFRLKNNGASDSTVAIDAISLSVSFTYSAYRGSGAPMSYVVTRRSWIKKKQRLAEGTS